MWPKRILFIMVLALLLYLVIYSWNQKTGTLDDLTANTGLEAAGVVLHVADWAGEYVTGTWRRYLDLAGVREENDRLRLELKTLQQQMAQSAEEKAELVRLRKLLTVNPPPDWKLRGARVIGRRLGANAVLDTILINRGYFSSAIPGTAVINEQGFIGRVLRSGPGTATVLLLTDPSLKVAVIGQESRNQGILTGTGSGKALELRFVSHSAELIPGEVLITSGVDDMYVKGIPVAVVADTPQPEVSLGGNVQAVALVDFSRLEEVLLLEPPHTQDAGFFPHKKTDTENFVGPIPAGMPR